MLIMGSPHCRGACDQSKPFDTNVWVDGMLHEAETPLPFYPPEFEDWAHEIIGTNTRNDIHASEIKDNYLLLCEHEPPSFLSTS